jgi:hypothetical protein
MQEECVDADRTLGETREDDVPAPEETSSRADIFDESLELEPSVRSELEESALSESETETEPEVVIARPRTRSRARPSRRASARLAWLEEQLEVRDDAIRQRVPDWSPGASAIPAEQAVVMAFDEIMSENAREVSASEVARKRAKEAYGKGVEAGAVGAVVVLGLIASGVALVYAAWEGFFA